VVIVEKHNDDGVNEINAVVQDDRLSPVDALATAASRYGFDITPANEFGAIDDEDEPLVVHG
jgi:hypothetical protein